MSASFGTARVTSPTVQPKRDPFASTNELIKCATSLYPGAEHFSIDEAKARDDTAASPNTPKLLSFARRAESKAEILFLSVAEMWKSQKLLIDPQAVSIITAKHEIAVLVLLKVQHQHSSSAEIQTGFVLPPYYELYEDSDPRSSDAQGTKRLRTLDRDTPNHPLILRDAVGFLLRCAPLAELSTGSMPQFDSADIQLLWSTSAFQHAANAFVNEFLDSRERLNAPSAAREEAATIESLKLRRHGTRRGEPSLMRVLDVDLDEFGKASAQFLPGMVVPLLQQELLSDLRGLRGDTELALVDVALSGSALVAKASYAHDKSESARLAVSRASTGLIEPRWL